ncbi:TPA: ABC transporter ATP-binding protein, partial [Escherichia coli]|nr:ABC transporter ATP-binding protein [Escherichia coli]
NGSGKSTLLQMICGTLQPTCGTIKVNGKIAALLELGSGFNPEFTGRENVYLNAAVYGLTRSEIELKFNDIVKFADIGDFIDQPVKNYSSGMYVRLAFAVIAHVDADILVVDEALAVGDAVFTQKCMRFIRKFQENGTLIFVSHDMASVQNLCEKALWLN